MPDVPPLPPADADGNRPAIETARVLIAQGLIRDRKAAGLSQQALADLAGVPLETISQIEGAKGSAGTITMDRLDAALEKATRKSE